MTEYKNHRLKNQKLKKIRTREILSRVDVKEFGISINKWENYEQKGCPLVNQNGAEGYITSLNALLENWIIHDLKNDEEIQSYGTLEELLEDGWTAGHEE